LPQAPPRGNPIQDYVTVAERIEAFYRKFPEGRIITHIVEHDAERGFILIRAEIYRNPDDQLPAATGHAYELKTEGYIQRTSYIEVCETSAVGRALAMGGFEVKRGIASREEMEKVSRATDAEPPRREKPAPASAPKQKESAEASKASLPAADDQKQTILSLLEELRPGDRRAQRRVLVEMTGKESRDDLTQQEAAGLITRLKREADEGSI
jgi:hypothetical protein